jgi:hypothetical protein
MMSKHIPRHARWSKVGPNEYRSHGTSVRFDRGAWWAWVSYRRRVEATPEDVLPPWQARCDRLGPFKRPRNAMMAAEEHALLLSRRHGDDFSLGSAVPGA